MVIVIINIERGRPTTAVENNWKKNQRWNYNKGRVNKGHHGTTNQHFLIFIKRESSVVVFLVDKSTLLVHTHHIHLFPLSSTKHHPWLNNCLRKCSSHTKVQFSYKNHPQGSDHSSSSSSHTTVLDSAVPIQRRDGCVIHNDTFGGTVTSNWSKFNTALARIVTFIVPNHWEKKRREKETSSLEGYFCNHKDQTKIRLAYCIGSITIKIIALISASLVCIAGV